MWYQGMIRCTKTIGGDVRTEGERDKTRKTSMHCAGREGCEELRMREDSRRPILKLQLGGDYEEKD
ncbi:hypothetical protein BOTNAR_0039g00120 [Botryotinia narcissicola]|uniref:Uncharacterized protein n=1 Tax=Botryotinia narcissicola TaxID=278944 RepID=A0A4Z1J1L6_9HELO|nr:hypothetical protein BOTNAR_0039g00120 [Botryotinia narcissicola]